MQPQGLAERHTTVDLSVNPADYFGAPVEEIGNARAFGLAPRPETDLYRVEYLYLLVFGNDGDQNRTSTDYGGIQVRASTHLWLKEGSVPMGLQRVMQRTAHRGANFFDSSIEEPIYGGGGGNWADGGYLSGFTPTENSYPYQNWEVEPVGSSEAAGETPGKIEWTTEVYLEVEETNYAVLSGTGQGIGNPWQVDTREVPPSEPVEAQDEWWEMSWNPSQSKYGAYDIHPPGRSASKQRAKKLHEKDVHLNGVKIGNMTTDGRVYLAKRYADRFGGSYAGSYSRQYILDNTPATPQAIAAGRKIAKYDESPGAIHLATKQARPDDFDPVDPDDVDVDREVREGSPGGSVPILTIPEPSDAWELECRQDKEHIRHLGYSTPPYAHEIGVEWKWPGFRPIEQHGSVTTAEDLRDDDQGSLDGFGGGDE